MGERLAGKIAIVTGGSRGIGKAIATAFAAAGARVVLSARKEAGVAAAAAEINAAYPGRALARACHVGHAEQVEALVDWAEAELGVVDVLVNNAGTNPYFGPLLNVAGPAWDKTFDVNLKGAFEPSRFVARRLMKAGQRGSIINVTSIAGLRAAPMQGVYGMTKAALISMTQTLAMELGGANIRVNAIAPGVVDTTLASLLVANDALRAKFTEHTALGRIATPDEIAGAAVYLASDESSFMTGQTLALDGGFTIF
jgi:NAD(P)-dependent dehydrogenase (short-subunit alcohol dehydrogenase family)